MKQVCAGGCSQNIAADNCSNRASNMYSDTCPVFSLHCGTETSERNPTPVTAYDNSPTTRIIAGFGRDQVGPLVGGRTLKMKWSFLKNGERIFTSKTSLLSLSEPLHPYIEGKTTVMRSPVSVVKNVACTLYYLADMGRLRKMANAFGLSRQVVSKIVRQVCKAITVHLGPVYIQLLVTESN